MLVNAIANMPRRVGRERKPSPKAFVSVWMIWKMKMKIFAANSTKNSEKSKSSRSSSRKWQLHQTILLRPWRIPKTRLSTMRLLHFWNNFPRRFKTKSRKVEQRKGVSPASFELMSLYQISLFFENTLDFWPIKPISDPKPIAHTILYMVQSISPFMPGWTFTVPPTPSCRYQCFYTILRWGHPHEHNFLTNVFSTDCQSMYINRRE